MDEHLKNVFQEVQHTTALVNAKKKEIEHMKATFEMYKYCDDHCDEYLRMRDILRRFMLKFHLNSSF